jgi:hypothetical protein
MFRIHRYIARRLPAINLEISETMSRVSSVSIELSKADISLCKAEDLVARIEVPEVNCVISTTAALLSLPNALLWASNGTTTERRTTDKLWRGTLYTLTEN